MKWKQLGVYFLVLVAVAGYYFFETAHKKKVKEREIESKKILTVKKDRISALKIVCRGEKPVYLVKKNKKWIITEPVKTDVDQFSLDNFLNSLVNISADRKITVKEKDLGKFGLGKPYITINFRADNHWKTLKIGDKNPTGENYYAALDGKNQVFMIASFEESSLDKRLFDLRDKRLFTLPRDRVDRIEVAQNNTLIKVVKKGENKWVSPDSPSVPIKKDKVDRLLDSLTWLRARKFVSEKDEKLGDYGLKEPSIQVVLAVQKDKSQTLLIGKEKDKTQRYAKIASRPGVVLISSSIVNDLPKSLFDLEDRNLLSFDTDSVGKINIVYRGKKYRLSRQKEKWSWAGTESNQKKPDTLEVNSLLWKIKDMEHQGKPKDDSYKKKEVEGSISLFDKNGKFLGQILWLKEESKKADSKTRPVVLVRKKEKEKGNPYVIEWEDLRDLKEKINTLLGKPSKGTDR